jgi:hypothetical protein
MEKVRLFLKNSYCIYIPLIIFVTLRIPSLFESFWYGDEAIYATLASGMHQGKFLYAEIWDHKPPLLYFFYYLAGFFEWNVGLVLIKILSIVFGITGILYLSKILQHFFKGSKLLFIALLFFSLLFGSTVFEANTGNAEVFYITFNILIFYLLLKDKHYLLIGFLTFLSFAIKIPSFVESLLLLFLFGIIMWKRIGLKPTLHKASKIVLGFILPLLILLIYFSLNNALWDFIRTVFIENVSYSEEMNKNYQFLNISLPAIYLNIAGLCITFVIPIYAYMKNEISERTLVIVNLTAIEIFAAFLSGRNYPHYLIQTLPGLTLLLALCLSKLRKNQIFHSFKYLIIFIIFFQAILVAFTRGGSLDIYAKPQDYYLRFINSIVLGNKDYPEFWWRDGDNVERSKSFANYLNSKYSDTSSVYIYTSESWVLALSKIPTTNKYTVWYHLGFNPLHVAEDIKNRDNAELFIVDEKIPKNDEFFRDLSNFEIIESYESFTIYRNTGGKNSFTAYFPTCF